MPNIPVTSALGYIGIFFLISGAVLILAGMGILIIQNITIKPGKQTWGFGLLLAISGLLFLVPEMNSAVRANLSTPTLTPTTTALIETLTPTTSLSSNASLTPPVTPSPNAIAETPLPVAISGFENQCINSEIWTPYTANMKFPKENNCWNLTSKGLSTYKNNLLFSVNTSEQSGSIYMLLPESGIVSFTIQVDKFKIGGSNGNLVFGIGNVKGWLQSGEFLFLRVPDPGSPVYYVFGNSVTETGKTTIGEYELGTSPKIAFDIKGLLLSIYIDDKLVVPSVTLLPSQKQVLWIGYRLPKDSELVASMSNFTLEK
jgi:hypothetical protein